MDDMTAGTDRVGEIREYRKKICLIGEYAVGKTSLVRRFVNDIFDDLYILTIGVKVTSKEIILKEKGLKYIFAIWDIGGHLEPGDVPDSYYMNTAGALLICDCTRKETLQRSREWANMLKQKTSRDLKIVVAANKSDLDKAFTESELKAIASEFSAPYYYTSAKTGENVEKAFRTLAEML